MIRYEMSNHIVTITVDRYEKRNSMDPEHSVELVKAWEKFRDDPEPWVAIVTGTKDVFCSGADLKYMELMAKEVLPEFGSRQPAASGRQ